MSFILPELAEQLALPWSPEWDLAGTRARNDQLFPERELVISGATLTVAQASGVEVRVWEPANPTSIILAIHGGGYTAGHAHEDDERNGAMSVEYRAVVVSPEYRLAPEHPFPAGPSDCLTALEWARAEYPSLPVYLYGDSAGAGLVETVACWHLDRGWPALAGLICLEPALDPSVSTPSMTTYGLGPMWSRAKATGSWQAYLAGQDPTVLPRLQDRYRATRQHGQEPGPQPGTGSTTVPSENADEQVARKDDRCPSESLPPVLVFVNPVDPLRDEGIEWALGLADAGARIELHLMPGTYHSALSVPGTQTWTRVRNIIRDFMETFPPEPLTPTPAQQTKTRGSHGQ